jgi:hypothetical protein
MRPPLHTSAALAAALALAILLGLHGCGGCALIVPEGEADYEVAP